MNTPALPPGRFALTFDSADTETVRRLCVALHREGLTATLTVGVNGPECWSGATPKLTAAQILAVTSAIAP